MKFFAKIDDDIIYYQPQTVLEFIKKNKGKNVEVVIQEPKNTRTLAQNRFYWMYLKFIETETGNNSNDLHELFKRMFLPPVYKVVLGKEVKFPRSTTNLEPKEFNEYMDKICAETQIPIPNFEL